MSSLAEGGGPRVSVVEGSRTRRKMIQQTAASGLLPADSWSWSCPWPWSDGTLFPLLPLTNSPLSFAPCKAIGTTDAGPRNP